MTELAHSDVVGGSSAGRVLACPGSVKLIQGVTRAHKERILAQINAEAADPKLTDSLDDVGAATAELIERIYREETTSPYAQEGTDLHTCMEWLLEDDDRAPEEVVHRTFGETHITSELYSEAISPAFNGFLDFLDQVFDEDGEDLEFKVEERGAMPGVPGAFGTADIIGKTSKRMVVWDWKFGAGVPVHPEELPQGMFYGRALAHTLEDWLSLPVDPDTGQVDKNFRVDIVISQPRIGDGKPAVWTTTFGRLEIFRSELVRAVAAAMRDDAPVKQGSHCRWCEAKHICPAKQQLGQRILAVVDSAASAHAVDTDTDIDDVDMKTALKAAELQFTPDDLADWLADADDILTWCDHIYALARAELDAGRAVTGKALDRGLANATWTEPFEKVDRTLGRYGLKVEERRKPSVSISPTQARKLLKGDEKHAKLIEKIIDRPPGKIRMVDADKVENPVVPTSKLIDNIRDKLAEAGKKSLD